MKRFNIIVYNMGVLATSQVEMALSNLSLDPANFTLIGMGPNTDLALSEDCPVDTRIDMLVYQHARSHKGLSCWCYKTNLPKNGAEIGISINH
jgi:hypothetical protein